MINETIVSSSSTEQIKLRAAASLIEAAKAPICEEASAAVLEVLDAECGQLSRSVSEKAYSGFHSAEAAADLAGKRLQESVAALADAEESLRNAPARGSWVKALIWSLCGIACFSAEFVLTWTALCFVLDVPRMTILGVLLGLAPPCGVAVLEVFLARLFEEPWQRLRSAPASPRRLGTNLAMTALLAGLALGNGLTIVHLAKAREEAIRIQRDVLSEQAPPAAPVKFDQTAIDRAILWISVCVCVDGSVFLLLALAQGALLRDRSRLNVTLAAARTARRNMENELAAAGSRLKDCAEAWREADQDAGLAADRYRAHCHYLLAEKNSPRSDAPLEDLVDRAIRLRFCA
jgi:hypothetical protein